MKQTNPNHSVILKTSAFLKKACKNSFLLEKIWKEFNLKWKCVDLEKTWQMQKRLHFNILHWKIRELKKSWNCKQVSLLYFTFSTKTVDCSTLTWLFFQSKTKLRVDKAYQWNPLTALSQVRQHYTLYYTHKDYLEVIRYQYQIILSH